jgi:hypothetical protein
VGRARALFGAVADEGETGRYVVSQDAEVLAGHDRLGGEIDVVLMVEAAGVSRDGDVARDCVAGAVGLQVGAGEDDAAHGVDASGDDVL